MANAIKIPGTTLTLEADHINPDEAESKVIQDAVVIRIRDTSIPEPEFNPLTFLTDSEYNVVLKHTVRL